MTATTGHHYGRRVGVTPSPETRAKLSAALIGNRRGAGNRHKTLTPEALARRRASIMEWWRKKREREPMPERWQRIAELRGAGLTLRAISKDTGISHQRVSQILQKIARRAA